MQAKFSGQNNKIKTRKEQLVYNVHEHFDRIHEKLNCPKRFSDNIEKKIKYDLFFIKTIWKFSRELEFDQPRIKLCHFIFHAALIHLLKIYFQV